MTPYKNIIETFRAKYEPNYLSVQVEFQNSMEVLFGVSLSLEKGDEMVHVHRVSAQSLTDTLHEMVRRSDFDNGR